MNIDDLELDELEYMIANTREAIEFKTRESDRLDDLGMNTDEIDDQIIDLDFELEALENRYDDLLSELDATENPTDYECDLPTVGSLRSKYK
jgi:predicted  nucleic acid-binding Zn-ribbon protein